MTPAPQDEPLESDDFSWTVQYFDGAGAHAVVVDGLISAVATFDVPTSGFEFDVESGLELIVTVTDSAGFTESASVTVVPQLVDVTFDTVPTGLVLARGGVALPTPLAQTALVGSELAVLAPTQCSSGDVHALDEWSDGTATALNVITVAERPEPVTAQFAAGGDPSGDLNFDGVVDVDDIVQVVLSWGPCEAEPCIGDGNCDGAVTIDDLILVILDWE